MNRERILCSVNEEERTLLRHVLDLGHQSLASGRSRSSCFLDERQLAFCTAALEAEGIGGYESLGGYDGASRRVILFLGFGYEIPFTPVVFSYRETDKLTHRDFLGTLMAQSIKREMIGDILVGKSRTTVFVMNTVLPVVADIRKIGGCGVKISYDFSESDVSEPDFDVISSTVQSLRLDSVLSCAIRTSREKTQELIRSKGVVLNHVITCQPGEKISQGDVFSVKGIGKFVLKDIGGLSKKDRIFITINKYK